MPTALTVAPAAPEEWDAVCDLLFQYVPPAARAARAAHARQLFHKGEIEPDGILVARAHGSLAGALVCIPLRGAGALVWPPQALAGPDRPTVEDRLISAAVAWLRRRGAKLAQALLTAEEVDHGNALARHGFVHVTSLLYLHRPLEAAALARAAAPALTYQAYPRNPGLFQQTLLRTYEATQDCPELNGVRSIGEIIDGHQAQGGWDPERWWLACERDEPVGVLLLASVPEWQSLDVSYLGVVPAARGRGVGRSLTWHALEVAREADFAQVTLAVDARNVPARALYEGLGFTPFDRREVYLSILCPRHG